MATARQAGGLQLFSSSERGEGAQTLKVSAEISGPGYSAEWHYYQGTISSGNEN